ncbi:MAG: phosphotriesterase-related protein [Gemmatimonadetes bacterium]|nr:phosphotriesterase-related protein [Gemmatimonadota bacterium]
MRVMTVTGPIEGEQLGITLPHEHIIVDLRHSLSGFDAILNDVDIAIDEVRTFHQAGGRSIVEVSNGPMGRDAQALRRISEETGVHIVAATGFHTENYFPRYVYEFSTNRLADLLVDELTNGIDGTDICAGIIAEIGTQRDHITPAEERAFRAAARANRRTGAAIYTHTYLEQLIPDQLEILTDEGVDPGRIIIGHLGDQRNFDRLRSVAAAGVYLGIDHIGATVHQSDQQRAKTVATLVAEGFLSQILLSHDICMKSSLHWHGGTGYDYLLTQFVSLLQSEGLTETEVNTLLVENPRRALAFDV